MEYADHLAALERESATLVAALRSTILTAPVPSCPEWTARELAKHVGASTGFWIDVVCAGIGQPKAGGSRPPDGDDMDEMAAWVEAQLDLLLSLLRPLPPTTHCWSWLDGHERVGFVARRWANETAIHRVDAELAAGSPTPVDGDLAVDGIEEIFVMAASFRDQTAIDVVDWSAPCTLHLHATDRSDQGDGEWLLTLSADGVAVERAHGKGDAAVQATAGDLELLLYQRPTQGEVTTFGDPVVLDRWYRQFTFG